MPLCHNPWSYVLEVVFVKGVESQDKKKQVEQP
jgi:hypothetical protein